MCVWQRGWGVERALRGLLVRGRGGNVSVGGERSGRWRHKVCRSVGAGGEEGCWLGRGGHSLRQSRLGAAGARAPAPSCMRRLSCGCKVMVGCVFLARKLVGDFKGGVGRACGSSVSTGCEVTGRRCSMSLARGSRGQSCRGRGPAAARRLTKRLMVPEYLSRTLGLFIGMQ